MTSIIRFQFRFRFQVGFQVLFQVLLVAATALAQTGAVHVPHDTVNAALVKGGVLVSAPQVQVAGVQRAKPGALETQKGTTILYVTAGDGVFAAGAQTQRLTKGDVLVVPAGATQSFTTITSPISYLQLVVPTAVGSGLSRTLHVDHDKVAATMKKAAPLADAPNLRVSGGFRPFASREKSPVAEIHANEADFFYIVEARAMQDLAVTVIDGKDTGPDLDRGP